MEMKVERKGSIEEEKKEKVDLSGMSLDTLPNLSTNVLLITELDISNNNLESIPESLTARLLNVEKLDVHSNQLKSLPNSIGCLSKLKVLNVSGNLIESLPKSIENCRALEELNVNFNKLTRLPDTIGFELTHLQKLSVNSNKLAYLPYSISHMTTLRILDARLNCLRVLPDGLENLINLQILNVSQNFQYLNTLPYSIGLLISLIELDISYNKITILPDSIGCLKNLRKLSVEGNPLVCPSMEVVGQGLDAIKEYLSERMKGNEPGTKRRSWIGKLVRYRTFNGQTVNGAHDQDGFLLSDYRSIDGLASPRFMGLFSPRRLFSPKSYFAR
ncbi:plant intracellular Ras-group-related LRR protein 6-like isoform X2 [Magnolia sinica]|nr:plant intracellular Ras-group-related LRR protein 6-like isoform X2 [Magnolia sinica]XP_058068094.1 plant intracellular Ras-group-related LRR protein 6-like isoform X2 [Magnolia sinica]